MKATQSILLVIALCVCAVSSACQPEKQALEEFQPKDDSLIKISFYYPAGWKWMTSPNSRKTYEGMGVFEPYRMKDRKNNEGGTLSLEVWINDKPQEAMQEKINSYLTSIDNLQHLDLLADFTLQIDVSNARWLTIKNTRPDFGNQPFIKEFIYLLSEDRYYTIILSIPESDLGGRFHTEFKAMVESIKILP